VLPVDEDHTLALSSDGRVSYVGGPTAQLAPSEALISISSSPKMSCGLRADHTIACWGDRPVVTPPDGPFVEVAVGNGAACGRRDDGSVTCWPGDKPVATAVPPVSFKSIGATASHGCGIRQDDTLLCWGWGDKREWSAPPVSGRFRKVEVTDQNNCALALDGVIICWGDQSSKAMPSVPVEGIFTSLSYRASQGCADRQDGAWICWGSNQFGEGTLPEEDHLKKLGGACALTSEGKITCFRDLMEAKPPWPTSTFAVVDGSERDGCALAADGSAKCWSNDLLAFDPVDPPAGHRYRMVKVAVRQACGLRDDTAELECWGRSSTGPTPAGRFSTFALTSTAGCGVREDGTVQCWAAAVNAGVVAVPAPSGVFKQVALGSEDGACALSGAGEIVCWGRGYLPMVSAGPFVQIARGTSWSALRPDGSLAIFDAPGIQPPAGKFVELDPHYSCALTDTGLRRCWDGIFR
jgi:hypothetical protein